MGSRCQNTWLMLDYNNKSVGLLNLIMLNAIKHLFTQWKTKGSGNYSCVLAKNVSSNPVAS